MSQELDVNDVLRLVKEAKKQVAEIRDSVDLVSSTRESVGKLDVFLAEIEQEVVRTLPEKREKGFARKIVGLSTVLMPVAKLLQELVAAAKQVMELLQR